MIGCLDVGYDEARDEARAAVVVARDWASERVEYESIAVVKGLLPYLPGQFFRRELGPLTAVLRQLAALPEILVVDGFVWLDGGLRPGLGAHLYEAVERSTAVVGVAKSRFEQAGPAREVLRGTSHRPLFVSAVGIDLDFAAEAVKRMAGSHRLPSLIRRADQLSRGIASAPVGGL